MSRDGVNHALGLVDLDLVLLGDTATDESESGALRLTDRDVARLSDSVTRELVALVLVEELGDDLIASGDLALRLAVGALALLVASVELRGQRLSGADEVSRRGMDRSEGLGGISGISHVDDGIEELASIHVLSFLRFMRLAVLVATLL